jgi:hypothetical protein
VCGSRFLAAVHPSHRVLLAHRHDARYVHHIQVSSRSLPSRKLWQIRDLSTSWTHKLLTLEVKLLTGHGYHLLLRQVTRSLSHTVYLLET